MEVKIGRMTLVLNEEALMAFLVDFFDTNFQNMADAMNKEMQIQLKGFGGVVAPQAWVNEFLANNKWEVVVDSGGYGIELAPENSEGIMDGGSASSMRTRVILWGTGEIWTKPGQETWHGGASAESRPGGKSISHAKASYRIPHWEHAGAGLEAGMSEYVKILFEKFKKNCGSF